MNSKKNSLLLVDDDSINLKALADILNQDYTVYAEKSGKNCIDTAKALQPDVILLDVMMPEIDGYEVVKNLKKHKDTMNIPIIFVTKLANSKDEVRGFSAGAVDYITKPFNPLIVKMRVQNQMKIINQMRDIQNMSMTDVLTGIGNRRFFNTLLYQEWERAKRQKSPISFIIADIDNFKLFNDAYGHLNGDKALQNVANIIKSELTRATDKVARWGGEEFAVILPDTNLTGARKLAENMRKAVENSVLTLDDTFHANKDEEKPAQVTISFGVHCVIPKHEGKYTLDNFVSDADKALYLAKENGKNRTCTVEDLPSY